MRLFIVALLIAGTIMAQETFEYTTDRNIILYQVPPSLQGPPLFTHRNTRLNSSDKMIFVTNYEASGLLKNKPLGRLSIFMIEWPEDCPSWSDVVKRLRDHLSVPGVVLTSEDRSSHGLSWKVFEEREANGGKWVGMSCYVPLAGKEILYVGLVIHDGVKISQARRDAFRGAVYELLGSITDRPNTSGLDS